MQKRCLLATFVRNTLFSAKSLGVLGKLSFFDVDWLASDSLTMYIFVHLIRWVNDYECYTMTAGETGESNCSFGTSTDYQKQECSVGGSLSKEILRAGCPWWQWDDC